MKKIKLTFDQYFSEVYGDRWESLRHSLLSHNQIMRPSFSNTTPASEESLLGFNKYSQVAHGELLATQATPKSFYVMDPASAICAKALEVKEDDFVLDMCAAPGGKSLILLESIKNGELWCNEISANRRNKLKSVIQEYVPSEYRPKVSIKGKDGLKYGLHYANTFDKILVDAPCSGEKHLVQAPKELEKWNIKRTQRLSKTQYGLLCSALLAVKPAGKVVYSTCSISPLENDEVIKRLLNKKKDLVELDLPELEYDGLERTEYGYIFLPDKSQVGPIFFSKLKKTH